MLGWHQAEQKCARGPLHLKCSAEDGQCTHTAFSWTLNSLERKSWKRYCLQLLYQGTLLQLLKLHSSPQPSCKHGYQQRGNTQAASPSCQAESQPCLFLVLATERENNKNISLPHEREGCLPQAGCTAHSGMQSHKGESVRCAFVGYTTNSDKCVAVWAGVHAEIHILCSLYHSTASSLTSPIPRTTREWPDPTCRICIAQSQVRRLNLAVPSQERKHLEHKG